MRLCRRTRLPSAVCATASEYTRDAQPAVTVTGRGPAAPPSVLFRPKSDRRRLVARVWVPRLSTAWWRGPSRTIQRSPRRACGSRRLTARLCRAGRRHGLAAGERLAGRYPREAGSGRFRHRQCARQRVTFLPSPSTRLPSASRTPSTSLAQTAAPSRPLPPKSIIEQYELDAARLTLAGNVVTSAIRRASLARKSTSASSCLRRSRSSWTLPSSVTASAESPKRSAHATPRCSEQTRAGIAPLRVQLAQAEHQLRARIPRPRPARQLCGRRSWARSTCPPSCR